MTEIISKDLVQERIDKYIEQNESVIIELIDKKIDVKVKEAIRDVFNRGWKDTPATEVINDRVEAMITLHAHEVEIDEEWVKSQVAKKVKSSIGKMEVVIKN